MSSLSTSLSQTVPLFGYQVNVGQALATTLAAAILTNYVIKTIRTSSKASSLTDKTFWEMIEATPTTAQEEGPVIVKNRTLGNAADLKQQMILSCTKKSKRVHKHLLDSDFNGTVLDLGCGIGANAVPLVNKGCHVTVIDKEPEALKQFNDNFTDEEQNMRVEPSAINNMADLHAFFFNKIKPKHPPTSIQADLTTHPYPKNVDAVVCVDTLPYLSPSQLRPTMEKIFQALRPGGQFIGTIFFNPTPKGTVLTELMGKLGAHFYPDVFFIREIITRCGFRVKTAKTRKDAGFFSSPHCIEFLAEKPKTTN